MLDLSKTESHTVFLTESKNGALIVSPTGEAFEFQHMSVVSELKAIQELLKEAEVQNLVIDLHRESYYGSAIIGALNSFVMQVLEVGGRVATCNASNEMQQVLKIMNLTEHWPHYPSRKKALNALKT